MKELLQDYSKDFEVRFEEIRAAVVGPPAFVAGGAGKLELRFIERKPIVVNLTTREALSSCVKTLTDALGPRFKVDPKIMP